MDNCIISKEDSIVVALSELEQVECDVVNRFSDGVYAREITMKSGLFIIGKRHLTKHLNIISKGKCRVSINGNLMDIEAPYTFESEAGCRKILLIEEDTVWTTIHVTDKKDVAEIESEIIDDSIYELSIEEKRSLEWLG